MKTDSSKISTDLNGSSERPLVAAAWAQFQELAGNGPRGNAYARRALTIPGYRVLDEIHRGGQGIVYQAIQESTHKKVAIKVLRAGPFADATECTRFDREVDILSRINHPHIVGVHDRGLTSGHAWYVMDFIPGLPLDAYVSGEQLSDREVLRLFVKICDAVQIAHLRGVVHRDLKPANIRIDLDGEPRVLDFGLAKSSHPSGAASSAAGMTDTGQFVGSLPWASPEQAEGQSDLIDIRTDVYSLGVVLYQLLVGRFPYPVTGRLDEITRHIVQSNPARPSAIRRGIEHDLELVILKCLAKEPERRYQSAGELASDLRRYLADQPVLATPPSASYRARKFVRRNRGMVLAGAAIVITLVVATGVSITFALRATQQRTAAEMSQARAEKAEGETKARADELERIARFQQEQFSGIDANAMGIRLRADLIRKVRAAAKRSNAAREGVDAQVAELEKLLAGSDFTGMALGALDENFFQPALSAIDRQFTAQPLVKARLLQTLASTLNELGLFDAAAAPQEAALAIRRNLLGNDHPETLASVSNSGGLLRARGHLPEAETYCRDALDQYRRVLGDEHPDTLQAMNNMGRLLLDQGRFADAEAIYRETLETRRRVLGEEHRDTLISIGKLGVALRAQNKFSQAEPFCREALEKSRRVYGNDHPNTLIALGNMASLLRAQGKLTEAEVYFTDALEKSRRVLGDDHPDTLTLLGNLGGLLFAEGKYSDAEPLLREVLEKRRRLLGDHHPNTLTSIGDMGALLWSRGRLTEAEPYFLEVLEKSRRNLGEEHPSTLTAVNNMGVLLRSQNRLAEAEPYLREALDKTRRALGDEHSDTLISVLNMGGLLESQGKSTEAIALLAPAEPAARRTFSSGHAVHLGRWLTALGCARVATAEFEAAKENLTEAYEIIRDANGAADRDRANVLNGLVRLFDAWNAATPRTGLDAEAVIWRDKLTEFQASTQPALSNGSR